MTETVGAADAPSASARVADPSRLVYPNERSLGLITLVLGLLVWLLLIVGTFGVALVYLLFAGVIYLFAQSGLVSHLRGEGARLSPRQYPALYAQLQDCCRRLSLKDEPEAYVLHGGGWMNAFAARFLGRHFVVLLSDTVDAMAQHPDGVRFYIGHELGHIKQGHLTGRLWRLPVLWLPLLGAAYARAQESTCDLHGLACSSSRENGARALAALAVGPQQWPTLSLSGLREQLAHTKGFWMSFHELCRGYPWLTKRVARLQKLELPGRHPLAGLLALFVPYGGRSAGVVGPLIAVAIIGVLAALAIPAYQDYTQKAKLVAALQAAQPAQLALASHFEQTGQIAADLAELGQSERLPGGASLSLNAQNMVLTLSLGRSELLLVPSKDKDSGAIRWRCQPAEGTPQGQVPASCR